MRTFSKTRYTAVNFGFLSNIRGDTSMQFALVVGAVSVAAALLVPLIFEGNSQLAFNNYPQIDRTITGSIKPNTRYHIRKSILDNTK